jgi:hypothetical protein
VNVPWRIKHAITGKVYVQIQLYGYFSEIMHYIHTHEYLFAMKFFRHISHSSIDFSTTVSCHTEISLQYRVQAISLYQSVSAYNVLRTVLQIVRGWGEGVAMGPLCYTYLHPHATGAIIATDRENIWIAVKGVIKACIYRMTITAHFWAKTPVT